jgi:hypothetical protein
MSAESARDLPRLALGGSARPQSTVKTTTSTSSTTRTAGEDPNDIIDITDDSADETSEERSDERAVSQDLGSVALRSLRNLRITAVEWLTMTERERPWRTARNQHEAINIARVFDQIGVRSHDFVRALMLKRIIALQHFDATGNVTVLDVVQGSVNELLPTRLTNAIYTQLQRRTQSQTQSQSRGRSSSYSSSNGDNNSRRSNKRSRGPSGPYNPSKKPRGPPPSGGAAAAQ